MKCPRLPALLSIGFLVAYTMAKFRRTTRIRPNTRSSTETYSTITTTARTERKIKTQHRANRPVTSHVAASASSLGRPPFVEEQRRSGAVTFRAGDVTPRLLGISAGFTTVTGVSTGVANAHARYQWLKPES